MTVIPDSTVFGGNPESLLNLRVRHQSFDTIDKSRVMIHLATIIPLRHAPAPATYPSSRISNPVTGQCSRLVTGPDLPNPLPTILSGEGT